MPAYALPVTETLINEGVMGKVAGAAVDAYLAQLTPDAVIRPNVMAAMTELSIPALNRILGEYANRGVLRIEEMFECEDCHVLNPVEDVSAAKADRDEYQCAGGCGADISLQEQSPSLVYQLLDTPA
jgi:hypothetical protein